LTNSANTGKLEAWSKSGQLIGKGQAMRIYQTIAQNLDAPTVDVERDELPLSGVTYRVRITSGWDYTSTLTLTPEEATALVEKLTDAMSGPTLDIADNPTGVTLTIAGPDGKVWTPTYEAHGRDAVMRIVADTQEILTGELSGSRIVSVVAR
jgi:hypothetical protein